MDPISQGVLGACAAQCGANRRELAVAAGVGWLGGMAPDLDVLIRSQSDPLLFLEYHRQFTHSLVFIPLGSLLVTLVLYPLFARRHIGFWRCWLFAGLGFATHGLLDACTTYGTQLLWPFSDQRVAWNVLPIIDPLYTLPLLAGVILAARRRWHAAAVVSLAWALAYPLLGLVQRERAEAVGAELAASRGHQPLRLEAKPGFANLLLWKVVYQTEERFHVDAVRVAASARVYPGESVPVLDVERDLPWLDALSQQRRDVERFRWFSNGYVAPHPQDPHQVIDIRYSLLPNEIAPLWSIQLDPLALPRQHIIYRTNRDASASHLRRYRDMLRGL